MGRKKRKIDSVSDTIDETSIHEDAEQEEGKTAVDQIDKDVAMNESSEIPHTTVNNESAVESSKNVASSSYAMTSHSGEIIQEDVYVSEGSNDSDDDNDTEIILTSSRMGIMRRGLHHQLLALQPQNRQWKRQDMTTVTDDGTNIVSTSTPDDSIVVSKEMEEELKRKREEEELAQLDPAQRAARLLIEKQRRETEAKIEERRLENEENVSRDPSLFSKRTAFDIKFDQIDDKPWQRGLDNHAEFFNYGLSEEDWLEYAEQQLIIRQELIDAFRQKRPPDPSIVPIQPRPKPDGSTNPVVEPAPVIQETNGGDVPSETNNVTTTINDASNETIGPTVMESDETETPKILEYVQDFSASAGGAWGAGAVPGSVLARLMEEQEKSVGTSAVAPSSNMDTTEPHPDQAQHNDNQSDRYRNKTGRKERDFSHYSNQKEGDRDADDFSQRSGDDYHRHDGYDNRGSGSHRHRPTISHLPPPQGDSNIDDFSVRSGVDHHRNDEYGNRGGGSHKHRPPVLPPPPPPPPGWLPPPPNSDAYSSFPPPPHGGGYYGGGRSGGRGGRFEGRGGRGGRGFHDRDAGGRGRGYHDRDGGGRGGGDSYQSSQQSGWKRPREEKDSRRRH